MDSPSLEVGSRFIASTMHEVRTPLQTIISTLELLEDTPLNKEQTEYIHQIEFSANALLGLANDVLDFTKISSKNFKLEIQPYDVIELTERVVDLITVESFNRGIEVLTDIDYRIPQNILGDPVRIQQIILNLVKNAAKFTESGYIFIRVSVKDAYLLFEIIDSGIGVPEDKRRLIFTDFYQVDGSSTRKTGGTGLGLSISKNLVNVMKGKIGILENPNGGSNFWFAIPLEKTEGERNSFSQISIPGKQKVLIVDDNSLALKTLKSKLLYYGIAEIILADSGYSALQKIQEADQLGKPFTAAFIDLLMNPMDGWRLASEIRSTHTTKDLKMILMVPEGQLRQDAKMKMLDWYDGYIYKPIKQKALADVLESVLNERDTTAKESDEITELANTRKVSSILDQQVGSSLNILVAEDTPINQKLLGTFLKKFGANVYLAENGQVAVDQIELHPEIDLIFMDIFMPIKSGIDATIELRNKGYKGIIIACTANSDPDDFKTYKKIGVTDIVVKPFKRDTIRELLEKWGSVLTVPNAKDIISLTFLENKSSEMWNLEDFMDTTGQNIEFAISLMDEYITQSKELMENLKEELKQSPLNYEKIELYTHTMKGSSASVSATRFADLGRKMNDAAKTRNLTDLESARINYEIDFITFTNIVANWKNSI
ncbi:hybrid sensor histidine kinase/response regulator [Treponema sp.]|uniref:hybrid sensor histidine kinase/response regulator n=1 Tax=Treponema sp. TaxID=166 RepID=UPI00298E0ACE|nr:response regulator [Treponema sp.]